MKKNEDDKMPTCLLKDADVSAMLKAADQDVKKAIILSAFGTLSLGEVCGLKYKDILRDQSSVCIHSVRMIGQDQEEIQKTKTDSSMRTVVLPKSFVFALGEGLDDNFIVDISPSELKGKFRSLSRRCGLSCPFHELRHYAMFTMIKLGMPDQYIHERSGVIPCTMPEDKKDAFTRRLNAYLEEIFCDVIDAEGRDGIR